MEPVCVETTFSDVCLQMKTEIQPLLRKKEGWRKIWGFVFFLVPFVFYWKVILERLPIRADRNDLTDGHSLKIQKREDKYWRGKAGERERVQCTEGEMALFLHWADGRKRSCQCRWVCVLVVEVRFHQRWYRCFARGKDVIVSSSDMLTREQKKSAGQHWMSTWDLWWPV